MLQACEWPVAYGEDGPCGALASLPPSGRQRFEDMATEFLWRWTARQFGLCQAEVRPCRRDAPGQSWRDAASHGSPWEPALLGGRWVNLGCGQGCSDGGCGCESGPTLAFASPVYDVLEAQVDGDVVDEGLYELQGGGRFLVRTDGGEWPYRQDMTRPLGSPDTWAVTVRTGQPVPPGGQVAAGVLACELAKAAANDSDCGLPRRWQSVTRQGVTVAMAVDTFEDVKEGRTGIWLIDSWVASVREPDIGFSILSPEVARRAARVRAPRTPLPRPAGGYHIDGGSV